MFPTLEGIYAVIGVVIVIVFLIQAYKEIFKKKELTEEKED